LKKAKLKKKRDKLVLKKDQLQEKVLIWSKTDPRHMDHMKEEEIQMRSEIQMR
jgi:hypothetical protein